MENRTGADRDGGAKNLPTGQTSRGYPASTSRNPKNNATRLGEHIAFAPQEGGAALQGSGRDIHSDGYPETMAGAKFNKGNPSTIPGPENINRGYTQVTGANVPQVTKNVGANRQNYGIDPGTPPQPNGDNTEGPTIPRFGVGTNGE